MFLPTEERKGVLSFEIDLDALNATDRLSHYQAYEIAVKNGWMQLDEVRYEEGRNPLRLKFIRLGLDTVIYEPESKRSTRPTPRSGQQ